MMSDSTNYNRESLIKDITEREKIILDYKMFGILDRDTAIRKILELRVKDKEVGEITIAALAKSSTPFNISSNEKIVAELAMQRDVLEAKLSALQ